MKRDSSGRLWLTNDVARAFEVTPAAVREMVREGRLRPSHVTPGGVCVFYRDEIEIMAAARRAYAEAAPRLKEAYGLARPKVVNIRDVQGELPLMGREPVS